MSTHSFVFVTGIHRSGTSPLHRCLRHHPQVSGFHNTGVPEDEGQHLQTVLPRGGTYGGPGRFGRHPEAHMTEEHALAHKETAETLFAQWSPHWDLSKPYLLEKTPITLTRARLFQTLFPNSFFLVLIRHPAAVALATYNAYASFVVPDLTIADLIDNWVGGYETFAEDAPHLKRHSLLRYEDFVQKPQETMETIHRFLGLPRHPCEEPIHLYADTFYRQQWWAMSRDPQYKEDIARATLFEECTQRWGYSLQEWSETEPPRENALASPIIETERLVLRRFTFADVDDLAALCAAPETMRFLGGVQPREKMWGVIMGYLREYEQTGHSFWAVVDKAHGRLIGRCGLQEQEVGGQPEMELAYQIAQPYWGRGFGTEAARALKSYAFHSLGFTRLIAIVDTQNVASQRVAEKNGMSIARRIVHDGQECFVFAISN